MNKVVADALTLVYKFLMPLCSKFNPALIERGLLSIAGEDAFDFSSQLMPLGSYEKVQSTLARLNERESIRKNPEVNVIVDDITNVDTTGVFSRGDADVIIGGPPCQGFSMAGARIRHGFIDDPRNYLFKHYFNVVKAVQPKAFVMENVKGMKNMQGGQIFEEILRLFTDPGETDGCPYNVLERFIIS